MRKKFLRRQTKFFKKFGKRSGSKKKRKWRKPRGRDNKMREKRKGRARKVEVGYKKAKKERGKIRGKVPVLVRNLKEAEKVERGMLVIIGKVGKKKRQEMLKKIKEKMSRK